MSRKALFVKVLAASALVAGAFAQEKPADKLPPKPWPGRAPDFATWTEAVQMELVSESNATATPTSNTPGNPPQPLMASTVKVTKTGPVVYREIAYLSGVNKGKKWQQWHKDGVEVTVVPGLSSPIVYKKSSPSTYYHPYERADFDGFDWLAEENFAGITTYHGRPCYQFKTRMVALNSGAQLVVASDEELEKQKAKDPGALVFDVEALLDKQSMVPVLLRLPGETHTYAYGQPPAGAVSIPPALLGYWLPPAPRPAVPAP